MVSIELGYNQFTGSIPDEWWEGSNLQKIHVTGNKITGSISSSLASLQSLKFFEAGRNSMTGSLPTEVGYLNSLNWLDISHNKLTGTIPSEIRSCRVLKRLWLGSNQLVGSITETIGKLTKLNDLSLHSNKGLSGPLPESLFTADIPNLNALYLYGCSFTGTIPSGIGNLEHTLALLQLSDNRFHGTLPREIARLTNLFSLWLQGNSFQGSVPIKLCEKSTVWLGIPPRARFSG